MKRDRKTKNCTRCDKAIYHNNQTGYCLECFNDIRRENILNHWLETGDTGCSVNTTIRSVIRDYIYEKQKDRCSICNTSRTWNGKPLNFVLDHIDGNAANNNEGNLRLICYNCDSQLDTFKSKNKKSARTSR
ncbi:NinG recombination protein [Bacillus phage CM1]|nr:NinG recombination protein [Bacillus phage CM1]